MDFTLNENQHMIAQTIRDFGDKHIRPKMMEWDESQEFPIEVFKNWENWGSWEYWFLQNMGVPDLVIWNM